MIGTILGICLDSAGGEVQLAVGSVPYVPVRRWVADAPFFLVAERRKAVMT